MPSKVWGGSAAVRQLGRRASGSCEAQTGPMGRMAAGGKVWQGMARYLMRWRLCLPSKTGSAETNSTRDQRQARGGYSVLDAIAGGRGGVGTRHCSSCRSTSTRTRTYTSCTLLAGGSGQGEEQPEEGAGGLGATSTRTQQASKQARIPSMASKPRRSGQEPPVPCRSICLACV